MFEFCVLIGESEAMCVTSSVCLCENFASMVTLEGAQGESSRILLTSAALHWLTGLSQGALLGNGNARIAAKAKREIRAGCGIRLCAAMRGTQCRLYFRFDVCARHERFLLAYFAGG